MKTVIKPWGKEEWLELNDKYCYKRIYINSGYKTSFQYHNFKKETNYIISGEAEVWLENEEGIVEKKLMKSGDYFNVVPPKKHRVIALTDIILQEVSTPEVDDVVRIDDDFLRKDGKIESEHKTPAVLILAAGLGKRLSNLTENINKALLPINNKAIISHIIQKFPKEYEFVVALGYKGDLVKDYCLLSYPDRKFKFVEVDKIDGKGSGPGYSALQCKEYLQRPFYITTCDCLIDSFLPHLDGNWLGVHPTSYPEKYSTIFVEGENIVKYSNKNENGYDLAFIGLAGIWNYEIFWNELERNIKDSGEVVAAFENPQNYPSFKVKKINWLDTGNLDDLLKTRQYFNDKPLSLQKQNNEITYKEEDLFIKFIPNKNILNNICKRADKIKYKIPSNFGNTSNYIYYKWQEGDTLYHYDSLEIFSKFLEYFKNTIDVTENSIEHINKFYKEKTQQRIDMFVNKYGDKYLKNSYNINGNSYDSFNALLNKINFKNFHNNIFYKSFHGDLQFDNIIYNEKEQKFTYIDWRESFAGLTESGDLYYDLAKLYGGCIIPYNKMKDEQNINFIEGENTILYNYNISSNLSLFKSEFEKWIEKNNYDFNKVKFLTGLIFLNMSPLHEEKFAKLLWFKSQEILSNYANK